MPNLTTNLNLIKPLGNEVAELWASDGGSGQAEQNKNIIDSFSARSALNAYTPVLTATATNPDLGTGADIDGRFEQLSNGLVYGWARFTWGSSPDAGGGTYRISLPVAIDETFHATGGTSISRPVLGNGFFRNNSNHALSAPLVLIPAGAGLQSVVMAPHTFAGKNSTFITSNNPEAPGQNDRHSIRFLYRGVV